MFALKFEIAEKIASTKKSNVHGGFSIIKSEDDLIVKSHVIISMSAAGPSFAPESYCTGLSSPFKGSKPHVKLKLTPFHGHFIVPQEGVRDAQTAYI